MTYRFELTCPEDGHPLRHVTTGTSNGWETRAVAHCDECGSDLLIHVQVGITNREMRRGGSFRRSARQRAIATAKARAARVDTHKDELVGSSP